MSAPFSILIVDDEANLRKTLGYILQRAGYQITAAANVEDAEKILLKSRFDLAFLDLKMPGVDGIVLLPRLRKLFPEMPVVILTAHATLETAMEAVRQGARDYLIKPVDPEQLLERVAAILSEGKDRTRQQEIISQIQDLFVELGTPPAGQGKETPASPPPPPPDPIDQARYLRCGRFMLDIYTHHILFDDQNLTISPTTFDYLLTLARHSPNPVSFETLVMQTQGYELTRAEARDMVRGYVHEIRKILEPDPSHPQYVITVRDVGYRLVG